MLDCHIDHAKVPGPALSGNQNDGLEISLGTNLHPKLV